MGTSPSESGGAPLPPRLDTSTAHSARVWNYLLGGKDNFAADREVGDLVLRMFPGIAHLARLQRRFLARAVRFLAGEAGIRQFLDIGTGLPTADNTHQIAQQVAPESRIVYVDNDPLVLVHARALLTSAPGGMTSYIEADVRDTEEILGEAARTLDFGQPIALMMLGIMGQLPIRPGPARSWPRCWTRCRRAATWPCPTAPIPAPRSTRRSPLTTRTRPARTTCAARRRSPASSTA